MAEDSPVYQVEMMPNASEPFATFFDDPINQVYAETRKQAWVDTWNEAHKKKNSGSQRRDVSLPLPGGSTLTSHDDIAFFLHFPFRERDDFVIRPEARRLANGEFDRENLFTEPIQTMRQIGSENGIIVPNNLIDRLHFVGQTSFFNALMYDPDVNDLIRDMIVSRYIEDVFVNPDTRAVFVNARSIKYQGKITELENPAIVTRGIYGLWLSMSVMERFVLPAHRTQGNEAPFSRPKKRGFVEWDKTDDPKIITGLEYLNKALAVYLTSHTLNDKTLVLQPYEREYHIPDIEELISLVGLESLVQGFTTQTGLDAFKTKLDEVSNQKNAMNNLAKSFAPAD